MAFPLISSGIYGYPKDKALKVAIDEIGEFLLENDMLVYVVVFDKASFQIGEKLFASIAAYIDDCYVDEHMDRRRERERERRRAERSAAFSVCNVEDSDSFFGSLSAFDGDDLDTRLKEIDESFSQMLLRKIDEKGLSDAECYKRANVDRKHFSKIRSNPAYRPSKPTALAFAVALELSLAETEELLRKAGYALSHSNKFDIIIEYFISRGSYNIFEINEALFAFDQSLLGA